MSESVKQSALDVLQSPKTAGTVSGGTVLTGLAETAKLIPWGDVAAAIGGLLSAVLIVIQLWKFWLDRKGARLARREQYLRIEALEDKARKRRAEGQPLRRDEDETYCPPVHTGDVPNT